MSVKKIKIEKKTQFSYHSFGGFTVFIGNFFLIGFMVNVNELFDPRLLLYNDLLEKSYLKINLN